MTPLHTSATCPRFWSRLSSGFWAYVDIYFAQLKVTFAIQLQYRVSAALWLVYTVLEPIIYLTVWSAVAKSSGEALITWTCTGCNATHPDRLYRAPNTAYSQYLDIYNGGISATSTNTATLSSTKNYF